MSKRKSNQPPNLPRIEVRVPEIHSTGKDDVPLAPLVKPFGGSLLKDLFTGQLRTRNPLFLALLIVGALLFPLGLLLALVMLQQTDPSGFRTMQFWSVLLCVILPAMAVGLACLVSLTSSIEHIRRTRVSRHKGRH